MVSSATPRRRRYRWQVVARPLVLLTVASLLSAMLVSVHVATSAAAALSNPSVITNNLQGGSATAVDRSNTDSKWTMMVRGFDAVADVVLLQEAGPSGPAGSTQQDDITTADGDTVQHFLWPVNDRIAEVFFLQTDSNADTAVGGRSTLRSS